MAPPRDTSNRKIQITNNQTTRNGIARWSDDDSGCEMDVGTLIARGNAEKRERVSYETQSSMPVDADASDRIMDGESSQRQDCNQPRSSKDDATAPSGNDARNVHTSPPKSMHQSPKVNDNRKLGQMETEMIYLLSSDESSDECRQQKERAVSKGAIRSRSRENVNTDVGCDEAMARRLHLEEQLACTNTTAASKAAMFAGTTRPIGHVSLRDRVGADGRIRWDGMSETIEEWLIAVAPTKVSCQVAEWIQVENFRDSGGTNTFDERPYRHELSKMRDHIMRTKRVPAAAKLACTRSILSIAKLQGYTTGKWMIFFPPDQVDEGWKSIAFATVQGSLGCSAKISPALDNPEFAILCCIYVSDFADRADVRKVLLALQQLGMEVKCGFKPDVFTMLGINSGNEWRLKPTIYTVDEASSWPAGISQPT
jgi:hypothetical protein